MDKYHGIAATVGGLIGAALIAVLKANQVDVVDHWATSVGGVGALVAVFAFALSTALKKRSS